MPRVTSVRSILKAFTWMVRRGRSSSAPWVDPWMVGPAGMGILSRRARAGAAARISAAPASSHGPDAGMEGPLSMEWAAVAT
jgi:hypothetical protein